MLLFIGLCIKGLRVTILRFLCMLTLCVSIGRMKHVIKLFSNLLLLNYYYIEIVILCYLTPLKSYCNRQYIY